MRSFRRYPSTWQEARKVLLWAAAFFIVVAGYVLRCESAGPMWLDELHTQWCVAGSFDEVFGRATIGNQSPLYFWANNLLSPIISARRMASLCSAALLVSIGCIVFLWSRSWTAVLVALILAAIDDSMIYFGVEARPYIAVQLVAVWQVHFFCSHLFGEGKKKWTDFGLMVTSSLLVNLHLTAALVLVAEFLFVLSLPLLRRSFNLPRLVLPWRRSIFVAGIVGLTCSPATWLAMKIAADRSDWNSVDDVPRLALFFVASAFVYVAVPTLLWLVSNRKRATSETALDTRQPVPMILVLFSVAILSTVLIFALAALDAAPLARLRYSITGFTLLFPLCGLLVAKIGKVKWRAASAISVVCLAVITNPLFVPFLDEQSLVAQRNEPWQEAVDLVIDDTRPVLLFPNLIEDQRFSSANDPAFTDKVQRYYRFPLQAIDPIRFAEDRDAFGLPIPREGASFELRQEQLEEVRLRRGCTMIVRARNKDAVRLIGEVEAWLQSRLGPITRRWLKRGVLTVVVFEVDP